jgi:phosphoribosyl-dephospho-CoA transferase
MAVSHGVTVCLNASWTVRVHQQAEGTGEEGYAGTDLKAKALKLVMMMMMAVVSLLPSGSYILSRFRVCA